jgi:hypothetical protein
VPELPQDRVKLLAGVLVKEVSVVSPLHRPPPDQGRTIIVAGKLGAVTDVASFYKKILQPLASPQGSELTIEVKVTAQYGKDPGSGLDAALDDGFDNNAFPGLTRKDSKGS